MFFTVVLLIGFTFKNAILTYFLLLVVAPLTILIASRVVITSDQKIAGFLTWLGGLSYPIYITHYPLVRFSSMLFQNVEISPKANVLLGTMFALAVAIPLVKLEPVIRRGLASIFKSTGVGRAV
jgi:peptidoglycan/LPS O-acetylase OafA/YrhL